MSVSVGPSASVMACEEFSDCATLRVEAGGVYAQIYLTADGCDRIADELIAAARRLRAKDTATAICSPGGGST